MLALGMSTGSDRDDFGQRFGCGACGLGSRVWGFRV